MKNARFVLLMLILFSGTALWGCQDPTPKKSDIFKDPIVVTPNPTQYQKLELALYEKEETIAKDGNPYDYDYFKVIGEFTSPSGKVTTIPAFWYQHATIFLNEADQTPPYGISGVASLLGEPQEGNRLPRSEPRTVWILPTEAGVDFRLKVFQDKVETETLNGS